MVKLLSGDGYSIPYNYEQSMTKGGYIVNVCKKGRGRLAYSLHRFCMTHYSYQKERSG
jgi:hypothetical protein